MNPPEVVRKSNTPGSRGDPGVFVGITPTPWLSHRQSNRTAQVSVPLNRRAFAYWDVASHGWKVDAGRYEIAVCLSSRGTATVDVK